MFSELGKLPREYSKALHGPYDPAVYYGKKVRLMLLVAVAGLLW